MSEADLLKCVLDLAKLYGWRTMHIRPARTEKGWRSPVQGDGKGFPDLLMVRDGVLLVVELKGKRGHCTEEQEDWLQAFRPIKAYVGVWRPADWHDGTILAALKGD